MQKTVLVVDDSMFMRNILKNILRNNNYVVIDEAENGKSAIDKYFQLKPDIVTMDITMPEMNGLEALKYIKNKDKDANIVVCSAMGQQTLIMEAIQSGAKDFIIKPFQANRVLQTLNKI